MSPRLSCPCACTSNSASSLVPVSLPVPVPVVPVLPVLPVWVLAVSGCRTRRVQASLRQPPHRCTLYHRDTVPAHLPTIRYVGNLPYSVDTEALTGLFSSCAGFVSAEVAADRNGEGSRGFGYVTFSTEADLNAAIAAFNNTEHGGRVLVVERELPKVSLA